jgi:hypothetical protein
MATPGSPLPPKPDRNDLERLSKLGDQAVGKRLAQRRARLRTALSLVLGEGTASRPDAAIRSVKDWLDSWDGVGHIIVGMTAQSFDVELRQLPHGWSAAFYPDGVAHSILTGSSWDATPWRAVQKAAWETLTRPSSSGGGGAAPVEEYTPP